MRHLRKFSESVKEGLDVEYIKHCFNDLVESSQYNEDGETGEFRWSNDVDEVKENESPDACVIFMNCPDYFMKLTPDGYRGDISEFIEVNNNLSKFLQKLNGAINNLKDEYPNYVIDVIYEQPLLRGHQGYDYYGVEIKLK